jgi:DHA1 family bicyclomycin/chloramphenicol resistance-like MFS transporter
MLGIVGMCSALAPLTGPLIGGYIAAYFGWEANFYAVIATTIILYLVLACFMPEVGRDTVAKINWQTIWKHYQQLFSNRVFVASILSYSFLFFAGGAFLAAAPFIYVDILGLPVEWIGYGMAPMFICYMLASGLAGKLEQVASANALISTTLVGACILMLAFTAWSIYAPVNIWGIVIAVSIYYVALGIAGPPLNNLSLSQANDENKGTASALLTITMMLGSALGALLVSLVYNSTLFPIAAVITSGVVLAALVYLALA